MSMTHKSRLWKSPELVSAFEAYSLGADVDEFPELLEEAGPRHIHDLVTEARTVLRRHDTLLYTFPDVAIQRVAGLSKLIGVTAAYSPRQDTYTFTRLHDVRTTLRDIIRRTELGAIAREYDDEFAEPELSVEDAMTADDASNWDYTRHTDVFFRDVRLEDESKMALVWEGGSLMSMTPEQFTVADYMTLGHLIEYDQ